MTSNKVVVGTGAGAFEQKLVFSDKDGSQIVSHLEQNEEHQSLTLFVAVCFPLVQSQIKIYKSIFLYQNFF